MRPARQIPPATRVQTVFYGWWLVGIAGFVILISTPFATGISAWFVVLRHGDNFPSWSAGELAWAYALTRVQTGLMGPMVGILIERFGSRRMNFLGLVISGFGFLLFSQVHELWHLYLAFLVINAGTFMGTWNAMMTALNSWFIRRKTMAMAMASEGRALGGVVLIPALVWAIDPDAERFGWRATTAGIGSFLMLIAFPLSRLVRNRPEDYGQHPDGDELPPASIPQNPVQGSSQDSKGTLPTWREVFRTQSFWLITIGHTSLAMVMVSIHVHLGLMLEDRGLSLQMIGWVVSTYMAIQAITTLVGGYIGDRMPIHLAVSGFAAIQALSVFVLVFLADSPATAILFAIVLGLGHGGRNPLTTAIWSVYYDRRAFARVTGMAMVPLSFGLFTAPLFAGYMFDATNNYDVPFLTVGTLALIGSSLFLFLGAPPSRKTAEADAGLR